jgi:hypothetical protein
MKKQSLLKRLRRATAILGAVTVFQFGGCDFGTIEVTNQVAVEQLLIDLIRGFIIDPIDEFVTNAVNEAFNAGE